MNKHGDKLKKKKDRLITHKQERKKNINANLHIEPRQIKIYRKKKAEIKTK